MMMFRTRRCPRSHRSLQSPRSPRSRRSLRSHRRLLYAVKVLFALDFHRVFARSVKKPCAKAARTDVRDAEMLQNPLHPTNILLRSTHQNENKKLYICIIIFVYPKIQIMTTAGFEPTNSRVTA